MKASFIELINVKVQVKEKGPSDTGTDTGIPVEEPDKDNRLSLERIKTMSANFDTLTNVTTDLDGAITSVDVYDADMDPNRVLPRNREWKVRVQWKITGLCAPGLGGKWHIRVNLESMGKGFEGTLKEDTLDVNSIAPSTTLNYDKTITLPKPDSVADFIAGAYKLVIIITHTNTGGGVTKQTRMAGFYEGRLLEFTDSDV
jgi:hypothetical protein